MEVLKPDLITPYKLIPIMIGLMISSVIQGQQLSKGPVSSEVFSPIIFNPAIAGSKDFSRLHIHSLATGNFNSQSASLHTRFQNAEKGAGENVGYSNFGLGVYGYHEMLEQSRILGGGISGAFHIPLRPDRVSGMSIGASVHALYNRIPPESEFSGSIENSVTPGADAGIFLYSPRGFAGFSARNLTSLFTDTIPQINDKLSLPAEYLFYGGFKILLSRTSEIVIEPSLIFSINDSLFSVPGENITPIFKIYVQNACFGTIVKNFDSPSFFLQYQFPSFYLGVLAGLPANELLISNNQVRIEISAGIDFDRLSRSFANQYRW